MRTILKDIVYNFNDKTNRPSAYVDPGKPFVIETELSTGPWLRTIDDKWSPEKTLANNPCGCLYVNGAKPGDALAVRIIDIRPGPLGHMALETHESVFPELAESIFGELFSETVAVVNGFVHISPTIRLPVRPMIGCLSTTLPGARRSHILAGPYGGNMDVQEVCAGAVVYLPVYVEGALLNVGDVHARMSDGEISAVEVWSEVAMSVDIERPLSPLRWPRIENDKYIITVACAATERRAFELAFGCLLDWVTERYGATKREAYMALAAAMEARCTVYLNPFLHTYVCKIDKRLFG